MKNVVVILASIILNPLAQAANFGSWFNDITNSGDAVFSATMNDSGNLLGQYCYLEQGNCVWLLGMDTACKEGDKYVVLANSDTGAAHISVYCGGQLKSGTYQYIFSEFDAVDNIVKEGARVGFAVPLQRDNFRVVRFDLKGSKQAITAMQTAVQRAAELAAERSAKQKNQNKSKGTKDLIL
ncbi:MAG TPA: hypothetical protein VFV39_07605 [Limnobacter sp.]|nr:hypothetical protein [Limnobacter sp.]